MITNELDDVDTATDNLVPKMILARRYQTDRHVESEFGINAT